MNRPDIEQLLELLLANELSQDQQQELGDRITGDDVVADEVFEQMWLEPLLRDSFETNPDAFVERLLDKLDAHNSAATRLAEPAVGVRTEGSMKKRRRRLVGALAGTSLVLALLVVLSLPKESGVHAATVVQLQNAVGAVEIIKADGGRRRAESGIEIKPGETVRTTGESSATISWGDGLRVTLTRNASLTRPGDQPLRIRLNDGLAHIARSAKGASAVIFQTRHVTVEGPETEFVLATSNQQTDVTVAQGKARLTSSDGRLFEVSGGESATADARSVQIRQGAAAPDQWSEDFERGLPDGWQGKHVSANLPAGSRGAVQTQLSRFEGGEPCHQIWSCAQWEHGLTTVHEDTCLNFTYWFKKADRVQLLMLLRPLIPNAPVHDVQMLQPADVPADQQWWNVPSGQWYTVSIPLSQLRNPVTRQPPTPSYIVTAFNLRPQDHACGLVIDGMWLTRESREKIEFKPLEVEDDPS